MEQGEELRRASHVGEKRGAPVKGTGVCGRMDEERPWLWVGHAMEMLYTLRVIDLQLFLDFCLYVTLWLAKPKKKKGIVSL